MNSKIVQQRASLESLVAEIADDFAERVARGERPDVQEYVERYPQLADIVRQVLATLELVRDSSSPGVDAADGMQGLDVDETGAGVLGDFRILRGIGRGGMGVVYEAEEVSLGRRVALKVLPFAAVMDPRQLQRFKNEAQAAATLHHTNIVPVFSVGCERGVHYYAMQYIEGQTLAEIVAHLRRLEMLDVDPALDAASQDPAEECASSSGPQAAVGSDDPTILHPAGAESTLRSTAGNGKPSRDAQELDSASGGSLTANESNKAPAFFRSVAELGIQVAEALDHAHQQGVVHRDVKPSNLIIDRTGQAWITDFGLARVEANPGLTMTGDIVGTLRYMSPEQALAKRVVIDHRTDIYSLGVTLYELLTLEPAFSGDDRQQLLRKIAFEEPASPSRLNGSIPTDVETIVLKAQAKNPDERYATAQDLADDLRRYLNDETIHARRPTLVQRAAKWARRHRTLVWSTATAAALVLIVTIVALLVSDFKIRGALRDRTKALSDRTEALATAQTEKENAKAAEKDALQAKQQVEAEQKKTQAAFNAEKAARRELTNTHYKNLITLAYHEWQAGNPSVASQYLGQCPLTLRNWEWHYVKHLCDGHLTVTGGGDLLLSTDGELAFIRQPGKPLNVWSVSESKVLRTLPDVEGRLVDLSGDNSTLLTRRDFDDDQQHVVWDARDGREILAIPVKMARHVRLGPKGRWIGRNNYYGHVSPLPGQDVPVSKVIWEFWDVSTKKRVQLLPRYDYSMPVFSPNGELVPLDNQLFNLATGETILLEDSSGGYTNHVFSPDGKQVAAASTEVPGSVTLTVWSTTDGKQVQQMTPVPREIGEIKFSPTGDQVAVSGSLDTALRIWDAHSGREVRVFHGEKPLGFLTFSPDGKLIAASETRGTTVHVWDVTTGRRVARHVNTALTGAPRFTKDGRQLVAPTGRGVSVIDADSPLDCIVWREPGRDLFVSDVSRDGRRIVVCAENPFEVRIWEPETDRIVFARRVPVWIKHAVLDDSGRRLAAAGYNNGENPQAMVWDVNTGEQLHHWPLANWSRPHQVVFGPQNKLIVLPGRTLSGDPTTESRTWQSWDLATGEAAPFLPEPLRDRIAPTAHSLAFHPDGTHLALAYRFRVKLYDLKTGKLQWDNGGGFLADPFDNVGNQVRFSRDGSMFWAGGRWETATGCKLRDVSNPASVAFSSDGKRLASGYQGIIQICHSQRAGYTPREDLILSLRTDDTSQLVNTVHFSPDGRYLVSSHTKGPATLSGDGDEIRVWPLGPFFVSRRLADQPNNGTLYAQRGRAHAELGLWQKAAADYERAAELGVDSVELHHERALVALRLGRYDQYRRICADIEPQTSVWTLAIGPGSHGLSGDEMLAVTHQDHWGGAALYRIGRYADAVARFEKAVSTPLPSRVFLSMALFRQGKVEQARSQLEQVEAATDDLSLTGRHFSSLAWQKRLELTLLRHEAEQLVNGRTIEFPWDPADLPPPPEPQPWQRELDRLRNLVAQGDFQQAVDGYDLLMQSMPEATWLAIERDLAQAEIWAQRAKQHEEQDEWQLAFEAYDKAIGLNLDRFGVWLGRGRCNLQQGKYPQAEADFRRAWQWRDDDSEAYRLLYLANLTSSPYSVAGNHMYDYFRRRFTSDKRPDYLARVLRAYVLMPQIELPALRLHGKSQAPPVLPLPMGGPHPTYEFMEGRGQRVAQAPQHRWLQAAIMFRTGKVQKAADLFQKLESEAELKPKTALFFAMALQKLGRHEDALQQLRAATAGIAQLESFVDDAGNPQPVWLQKIEIDILRHEAATLITGKERQRAGMLWQEQNWDEAVAAYGEVIDLGYSDWFLFERRGRFYAMRQQFDEAAENFHQARLLAPERPSLWLYEAKARLALDEDEAYHRACRAMFAQFLTDDGELEAGVAEPLIEAAMWLPDVVEKQYFERLSRVAFPDDQPGKHFTGIAAYRAGDFQRAAELLEMATYRPQLTRCFLAMARQQLGDSDAAASDLPALERWHGMQVQSARNSNLQGGWYRVSQADRLMAELKKLLEVEK